MYIWVIGKNGLLGSYFCKVLSSRKISYFSTSQKEVDILDPLSIRKEILLKKPTHIINCAAYTDVEKAEVEEEKAYLINSKGVENLVKEGRDCKLIHFSTDYLFNGEKRTPYREDDLQDPLNVYGKSKQEGEKWLGENALCIRVSSLFGGKGDFVSKMESLFKTKEKLSIINDQMMCPTFAKDVVVATLLLLEERGVYHFSNSDPCSWFEYANFLHKELSKKEKLSCERIQPILAKDFLTKAKRPLYSVLSLSKIRTLGLKPRIWQLALKEYLDER